MKFIPLSNSNKVAMVDDEDYPILSKFTWALDDSGYASATIKIHRMIMTPPSTHAVDHVNKNRLDNQKENLRICTRTENNRGRTSNKNSSSIYKGVIAISRKKGMVYTVKLKTNGKVILQKTFKTEVGAAMAYDEIAREIYGEYGAYNFPRDGEKAAHNQAGLYPTAEQSP